MRLLDRANNRVALTEEGRLFLFDSKKLLAMCAESVAAVQRMNRGESSQLNIGYVANIHYGLLPATLGAFRKLCPRVALNLFDMTQRRAIPGARRPQDRPRLRRPAPRALRPRFALRSAWRTTRCSSPFPRAIRSRRSRRSSSPTSPRSSSSACPQRPIPARGNGCSRPARTPDSPAKILQEADVEPTAIKFVADGLGVALMPEQITGLPHEGVVFRPLSPPLRRESTIAWRADNPSKPLKDYIQIVKELSRQHVNSLGQFEFFMAECLDLAGLGWIWLHFPPFQPAPHPPSRRSPRSIPLLPGAAR